MKSVEEKVEYYYKKTLEKLNIRVYNKTDNVRDDIDRALTQAVSKSGGSGNNYPDMKLILVDDYNRSIPVMVEAKGSKGKLEKLEKSKTDNHEFIVQVVKKKKNGVVVDDYSAIQNFAVNGALHYALALLEEDSIDEVIAVGINGSEVDNDGNLKNPEVKGYYISKANKKVPKLIDLSDDLVEFKKSNITKFFEYLDELSLTEEEKKANEARLENELEDRVIAIHQRLYDDKDLKTALSTNEKLYLFCGLIMAGLKIEGTKRLDASDLPGNDDEYDNDGQIILRRVKSFLNKREASKEKTDKVVDILKNVFEKKLLWKPTNGVSLVKVVFEQIANDIVPLLESEFHLDFTGKILNRLSDWVTISNDVENDVVLTPRYVTRFMAQLAQTNMNSFVWDKTMGTGGFLVAAMDIMIADAKEKIKDKDELEAKIKNIKRNQLLGVEILDNVYILAVLNMVLMGDGSSRIFNDDGHKCTKEIDDFPATVFLLNPPYSAPGKGFDFVEETLEQMTEGYACILIQENAGSGEGLPYTKRILKNNTLVASIHMPADLFGGKASVQAGIYLFKVARPHEADDLVTFIDMSEDGYARQNRKKSSQNVNLKNVDDADGRYAEVVAKITGKKAKTDYYTEENGLLIKDTISSEGNDWTFAQHREIDLTPTMETFMKTRGDYLAWKVGQILNGGC